MLKETEETIVFFVTFLSLVAFQFEGARAPCLPGYAYDWLHLHPIGSVQSVSLNAEQNEQPV